MNLNLYILKATGRLNPYIKDIENIFSEAERKITKVLPVKNVDIVVVDNPDYTIPETGIGGNTYSPDYLVVSLDPTFVNFKNVLQTELLDTFAHELHHAARWQTVGYGETLLETMISEGLADHFEIEITKKKNIHPWDKALDEEQNKLFATKAVDEYSSKDYRSNYDWLHGSTEKEIPTWTGYTLGFQLVREYFKKHPESKASTLYNLPAEEFIK